MLKLHLNAKITDLIFTVMCGGWIPVQLPLELPLFAGTLTLTVHHCKTVEVNRFTTAS